MNELHDMLSTKFAGFMSWCAAFLGLGTAAGIVNITVGVLSAIWLSAQLWNYFTFTLPKNRREKATWDKQ